MKCEKKKKNKHKSPEKGKTGEEKDGTRTKGIKLLDKLFEEKTADEILALSRKHDVVRFPILNPKLFHLLAE